MDDDREQAIESFLLICEELKMFDNREEDDNDIIGNLDNALYLLEIFPRPPLQQMLEASKTLCKPFLLNNHNSYIRATVLNCLCHILRILPQNQTCYGSADIQLIFSATSVFFEEMCSKERLGECDVSVLQVLQQHKLSRFLLHLHPPDVMLKHVFKTLFQAVSLNPNIRSDSLVLKMIESIFCDIRRSRIDATEMAQNDLTRFLSMIIIDDEDVDPVVKHLALKVLAVPGSRIQVLNVKRRKFYKGVVLSYKDFYHRILYDYGAVHKLYLVNKIWNFI